MAIYDLRTTFADSLVSPTATGTNEVGDVIDIEVVRDIGQGQPVYWIVMVEDAFTSGTSAATVEFEVRHSTDSTVDGSDPVKVSSGPAAVTDLNGDYYFVATLPASLYDYERYVGMTVTVAGEALTAGTFSSFLSLDPIGWKAYPEGQN